MTIYPWKPAASCRRHGSGSDKLTAMRILVVSDISGYCRGGVPAETRLLLNGLRERGHVVALAGDIPLSGVNDARHFPVPGAIGSTFAAEIPAIIAEFRPDFVHVMHLGGSQLLKLARVLRDFPWACTVHAVTPLERKLHGIHGHEELHYIMRAIVYAGNAFLWRRVYRSRIIPNVVVHNEEFRNLLVAQGFPANAIRVIPLSFAPDRAPRSSEHVSAYCGPDPLLVTVGGIAHTKGQHDAVTAVAALRGYFPRLRYQVVGEIRDSSYLAYLRRRIRCLDLADRVTISTDFTDVQVRRVLRDADLYIQPSHEEGFCLAFAEAAAIVPRLLGTLTGAIADISAGDPGARVVPIRSPAALAAAARELLATELAGGHMEQRWRRLSDQFSRDAYLRAHEELYQSGDAVRSVRAAVPARQS